ncbi:putative uncharacterized protein DDB_G0286901 [Lucilia cuprina]|uniref:putative uncharacterized protein DDB_G0286901 n=1 Tax=Lucilia cuprina TaxID=7375 RepID=UPI001F067170|nr:putative uncharacterized protein DDB_G0286901 [Lucilia cuprina]
MLKSSKSMISSTHDQLLNVIYKIKNCYQHHKWYFDDLFSRCNNIKKQKRRSPNARRNNKNKPKTKYLNSNNSVISSNDDNSNINITTAANNIPNQCYCANFNVDWSRVNLKKYLRHIWFYFQKNFNNIQLVIVIFLLALITTTAHSIDTQEKPHGIKLKMKTTTSPSLLDASHNAVTSPTSRAIMPCYHFPNSLQTKAGTNSNLKFKPNICHNIRHIFNRHRTAHRNHIMKNNEVNIVNKTNYSNKQLKLNSISNRNQNPIHFHHYQHNDNQKQHHNQDDSSVIMIDKQIQNLNSNTNIIKFKNNINKNNPTKENTEDPSKNNNLNLNKFLQHIRTNNYANKNNNNYNNNINSNNFSNDKLTFLANVNTLKEDANDVINDQVVNDEHIEINNNTYTSLNLLPPVTTIITSSQTFNNDDHDNSLLQTIEHNTDHHLQQQHMDHIKLMKLVMDGLGLKKAPNMKTANISQEEYVTKYREYLQRVHTRKRRELRDVLGEYDENILRPLEIFSIVSSSASMEQEHFITTRKKRDTRVYKNNKENIDDDFDNDNDDYDDGDKKQSLEERVKNILLLKKKYQKPRSTNKQRDERKTNIRLMFALKPEFLNLSSSDIEEANIRLVLIHSPILAIRNSKSKKQTHTKPKNNSCSSSKNEGQKKLHQMNTLNLKLYFISRAGKRVWLDGRKIDIHVDLTKPDETHTQWLQFDVSKAVKTAIDDKRLQHVVLELQCDNCKRIGARILNDAYNTVADALADDPYTEGHQLMPVLNIIGHFDQSQRSMRPHKHDSQQRDTNEEATTQHHYHHQTYNNKNRYNRRTNCYKANQRCCRHSMEVTFKEIKGFEFIIQPKVFDAGYCHGRCPPRYNPAHHHAMLQSLIWKQNHHKAPRPCCAPSKLVELEGLHVDEKDSEKLKISTWSDMKVVECACS